MTRLNRRSFLQATAGLAILGSRAAFSEHKLPAETFVNEELPSWKPGMLDIHHINTGRGNSSLVICPDGTSILVDAGAANSPVRFMNEARPNDSLRPGQWIARYVQRHLRATGREQLDYLVVTHFHGDHMGELAPDNPKSRYGDYHLTGVSDVAELLQVGRLIDRGFPDYSYPEPPTDDSARNYIAYAHSRVRRNLAVEQINVGSANQIILQNFPNQYPSFSIRNLGANGNVWTGNGDGKVNHFPDTASLSKDQFPSENMCSIAMRLTYGAFSYYTGSDLTCDTNYDADPWRDIETFVGKICGKVSVSTVNHHGYFDATGPDFVRALRPQVWVMQSWHASHPAMSVLANIYSERLYSGPRDVFSVGLKSEAWVTTNRFASMLKSHQGHVLLRVSSPGDRFHVFILDDLDETNRIGAAFGPYTC
jgi:hypothetical protein